MWHTKDIHVGEFKNNENILKVYIRIPTKKHLPIEPPIGIKILNDKKENLPKFRGYMKMQEEVLFKWSEKGKLKQDLEFLKKKGLELNQNFSEVLAYLI